MNPSLVVLICQLACFGIKFSQGVVMKVSPISQNQYNSKNPTFNAVNQKYLQKAIEKYEMAKPNTPALGHILTCIDLEAIYGLITYQDAIDTLEAIKPYAKNFSESIAESIEKFKRVKKQSNQ